MTRLAVVVVLTLALGASCKIFGAALPCTRDTDCNVDGGDHCVAHVCAHSAGEGDGEGVGAGEGEGEGEGGGGTFDVDTCLELHNADATLPSGKYTLRELDVF